MKIGMAYDLKEDVALSAGQPEDALEEYDCLETVQAIATALEFLGHVVVMLGGGKDFLINILQNNVDFVFNIAEGRGNYRSREAQVPAILEMLNMPYSGADPQCLAICLDKPLTKKVVAEASILTPAWQVISDIKELKGIVWDSFPFPAFVKPAYEGSSKGIRFSSRVKSPKEIAGAVETVLEKYGQPAMLEEFIPGDEVTVGIVGTPPQILGIMRVLPRQGCDPNFIYSLEVKREWEKLVSYECPARLPSKTMQDIAEASLKAFKVLGCRDVARIDFRVDTQRKPYLLEVNPLPGLRPGYSDLPIMAQEMGYEYKTVIGLILNSALRRQNLPCLGFRIYLTYA